MEYFKKESPILSLTGLGGGLPSYATTVLGQDVVYGETLFKPTPYWGAGGSRYGYSGKFSPADGSSFMIYDSNAFDFGTSGFTFEFWIKPTTIGTTPGQNTEDRIFTSGTSASGRNEYQVVVKDEGSGGKMRFEYDDGSKNLETGNGTITTGSWYHVAITRGGGNIKIWINGTQEASTTSGADFDAAAEGISIGNLAGYGYHYDGLLSNLRITGEVVYSSAFTPSTVPLTLTSQGVTASNVVFLGFNQVNIINTTKTPSYIQLAGGIDPDPEGPFTLTNSGRPIVNGVDLSSDGGMVIIKPLSESTSNWWVFDSVRGRSKSLITNSTAAQESSAINKDLISFDNDGFTVGPDEKAKVTEDGVFFLSWAFKRQKGFVDIVKYSGNGVDGRVISHGLDSVPGCMWVKRLDAPGDWMVYHKDADRVAGTHPQNYYLKLNNSDKSFDSGTPWDDTAPTSNNFTVSNDANLNASDAEYVAYLFASDDERFGYYKDKSMIKCGGYVGSGASPATGNKIDVGWTPQYVIIKNIESNSTDWMMFDEVGGVFSGENNDLDFVHKLNVNTKGFRQGNGDSWVEFTQNGFSPIYNHNNINASGDKYIYIAIRAQTGAVTEPTVDPKKVFTVTRRKGGSFEDSAISTSDIFTDMVITKANGESSEWVISSRNLGEKNLKLEDPGGVVNNRIKAIPSTDSTAAVTNETWTRERAMWFANTADTSQGGVYYMDASWKRHEGFDYVNYVGTGSARTVSHNLNQTPEMIWVKILSGSGNWTVYHMGLNGGVDPEQYTIWINNDSRNLQQSSNWNNTAPTTTNFTVGNNSDVNTNNQWYQAYLFSSVDGVSKMGYYTGNGTATGPTVTLGFQARFIIIKNITASGDWVLTTSMNDTATAWWDRHGVLNDTAAFSTDYVKFNVTSTGFNAYNMSSGGWTPVNAEDKYIYYAHA